MPGCATCWSACPWPRPPLTTKHCCRGTVDRSIVTDQQPCWKVGFMERIRAFFNIEFCVFHAHTLPEVRCCTQFLPPPFLHKDAIWRYDAYLIVLIRFSASISSSSSRK